MPAEGQEIAGTVKQFDLSTGIKRSNNFGQTARANSFDQVGRWGHNRISRGYVQAFPNFISCLCLRDSICLQRFLLSHDRLEVREAGSLVYPSRSGSERQRLGDLDAVDAGREDAACVPGTFTCRIQSLHIQTLVIPAARDA